MFDKTAIDGSRALQPLQLGMRDPERLRGNSPSGFAIGVSISFFARKQSALWHLAVNKQAFFFTVQTEAPIENR